MRCLRRLLFDFYDGLYTKTMISKISFSWYFVIVAVIATVSATVTLLDVTATRLDSSSSTSSLLQHPAYHRNNKNRALETTPCGKEFSVYNVTSNTTNRLQVVDIPSSYFARILLDQYPQRRINILFTPWPCYIPVTCVRLALGNFHDTIQTSPPFALYGDEAGIPLAVRPPTNTSVQLLQAWTYKTTNCTGDYDGYDVVRVHLAPRTSRTFRPSPIQAMYNGIPVANTTTDDINNVVTETCHFILKALSNDLLYRTAIDITKYKCLQQRVTTAINIPTKKSIPVTNNNNVIIFRLVLRLSLSATLTPYGGSRMFTEQRVNEYLPALFTGVEKIDILCGGNGLTMSQYIQQTLPVTNHFRNYTSITLL